FSNGGMLNLDLNKITPDGGLQEGEAKSMGMKANLLKEQDLPQIRAVTGANTGADPMTNAHMRNWMECLRSRKKCNGDVVAAYNHSIANIMVTAALHTGEKVTFDEERQEVLAGGKVFTM
ncbi:MAG: gfo/Idh/MocA family oxidoreductase, partial [Bacteroidales bacterium]|nr:gfo/Idh/MocA family oxidoreductase [Bacteroidales bacterium]